MIRSHDPTYPLFPILSFVGFVLALIPLPWHIQAWNSGTCAFMLWTAIICLVRFVDSVVWAGDVNNTAPIWCDISSQISLGATIGIPASALCISRRLYKITAIRSVSVTREDKRRAVLEDAGIALGIPILVLIMHIPVHPHRFDIYEDIGCTPVTYNTLPAYFLFFMWPVVLGSVSFVYSCLNLRSFYIRRAQFSNLVAASSAMNTSRYIRLMVLAFVDIMFTIPLGVYVIYIGTHGVPLQPWISWEETHFEFWRVRLIPALIWRSNPTLETSVELNRWLCVLCAFLFFALFGFASEAKKNYSLAFWWVARKFGFQPHTISRPAPKIHFSLPKFKTSVKDSVSSGDALPVYAPNSDKAKAGFSSLDIDLDSFTDKATSLASPSTPSTPPAPPPYRQSRFSASTRSFVSLPDTDIAQASDHRISTTSIYSSSYAASISTVHCDTPTLPHVDSRPSNQQDPESPLPSAPVAAYHRPFSPPYTYPIAQPHRGPDTPFEDSIPRISKNPFEAL